MKGTPEYVKRHMKEKLFSFGKTKPAPMQQDRGPRGVAQDIWHEHDPVTAEAYKWRANLLLSLNYTETQVKLFVCQPWYCLSLHVRKAIKRTVRKHPAQFIKI